MTPAEKAKKLVNMWYEFTTTQAEAIRAAESVVLTTLCQKIDSIHGHLFHINDFDFELTRKRVQELKFWQEVAAELQDMFISLPV